VLRSRAAGSGWRGCAGRRDSRSATSTNGFPLSEESSSDGVLIAVEAAEPVEAAPLLAATPIEDFVKVMNDLPR